MKNKLNKELSSLYKKIVGRGPKFLKTFIHEDMIIVRFDWYKETVIKKLYKSKRGENIASNMYRELFLLFKNEIKKAIKKITGVEVKRLYFDSNIQYTDEDKFLIILLKEKI